MGLQVSRKSAAPAQRGCMAFLTTAWSGSSRSSSPAFAFSFACPFLPFGGMVVSRGRKRSSVGVVELARWDVSRSSNWVMTQAQCTAKTARPSQHASPITKKSKEIRLSGAVCGWRQGNMGPLHGSRCDGGFLAFTCGGRGLDHEGGTTSNAYCDDTSLLRSSSPPLNTC